MSWSVGWSSEWRRHIGYGVPAYCDHPSCRQEINRGLSHVCCDEAPEGGDRGCGLYFCSAHHDRSNTRHFAMCPRCHHGKPPYLIPEWPLAEHPDWLRHITTDDSWQLWRSENPDLVSLALVRISRFSAPAEEQNR